MQAIVKIAKDNLAVFIINSLSCKVKKKMKTPQFIKEALPDTLMFILLYCQKSDDRWARSG